MTGNDEILLAKFTRKDGRELRLSGLRHRGRKVLVFRYWAPDASGEMKFKGVAVGIRENELARLEHAINALRGWPVKPVAPNGRVSIVDRRDAELLATE